MPFLRFRSYAGGAPDNGGGRGGRGGRGFGFYKRFDNTASSDVFRAEFFDPAAAGGSLSITASHSIGDITQTATLDVVDVALSLTASQAIPAITQSATLALRGALTASQTIPAITQAGTLANRTALTANQSIGAITQSATLANRAALTASQTIPAITQVGTLANVSALVASQAIGAITQSGAALDQQENLQAGQSIPPITQAATLTNRAALTASQAIGDISQSATLATPASGIVASQPIAPITQAATLAVIPRVEANQPIPAITQAGLLDQDEKLTAAQAIPPITQAATLQGGALAALFLSASQNIGEITQSALLSNDNQVSQPGASWPAPSGYYARPRDRKPTEQEIEEAAQEVAEIVDQNEYFVSPKQIARMAKALMRREVIETPNYEAIEAAIQQLKASIESAARARADLQAAIERRKLIERKAAELVAMMAYLADLQDQADDDLLLMAVL